MTGPEFYAYLAGLTFTRPVEIADLEDLRARLRERLAAGVPVELVIRDTPLHLRGEPPHVEVGVGIHARHPGARVGRVPIA